MCECQNERQRILVGRLSSDERMEELIRNRFNPPREIKYKMKRRRRGEEERREALGPRTMAEEMTRRPKKDTPQAKQLQNSDPTQEEEQGPEAEHGDRDARTRELLGSCRANNEEPQWREEEALTGKPEWGLWPNPTLAVPRSPRRTQ
jgi:hypothetical protein